MDPQIPVNVFSLHSRAIGSTYVHNWLCIAEDASGFVVSGQLGIGNGHGVRSCKDTSHLLLALLFLPLQSTTDCGVVHSEEVRNLPESVPVLAVRDNHRTLFRR